MIIRCISSSTLFEGTPNLTVANIENKNHNLLNYRKPTIPVMVIPVDEVVTIKPKIQHFTNYY